MKTTLKGVLVGVVLLVLAGQVFAYPPDNAAVLYYKAFMLMEEPNDAIGRMLKDSNNGSNEQIRKYVESNRKVIKLIVTAAEIKNCDWGYDFSEGFNMPLPELAKYRNTAYLLTADAKELAGKGDYKTALERCITIHKMGIHLGGDIIISKLVGNAIGVLANKRIVDILPQVSGDCEMLEQLRTQLADISRRVPSMRTAIGSERKIFLENPIDSKGIIEAIHNSGLSRDDLDKADKLFRQHEENEFYIRSTDYYQRIISRVQMAYDLPYPEAKQKLEDLYGEVENDAKEKPEAVIAEVLFPVISRVLTTDTRAKTHLNAVLAGIEIYIIKAKTGKLPDELPAGLPKDLFSGKDFLYEKTGAGFTLTGQGKDLDKDIVQKYEFKVTK
ncbi:MAG: hypothetical protein ABSG97_06525 [Sedimentisphaerales bacterium]|jgi:hypothetical protein